VFVRNGRAENELGIGQRFEFHRLARWLESCEVPVPQFVRHGQHARRDGDPENCGALGARNASARRPSGVLRDS